MPKGDKSKFYMMRAVGSSIHEMWDVTLPEKPQRIATISDKLRTTHEQWWECDTGIAYIVSGVPDWRVRRMTQVYDLSDPANPKFIRNFGLVGQEPTAPKPENPRFHDGHGAFSTGVQGNRLYFGYGNLGDGALQIVDRKKLLEGPPEPTAENLRYPQISFMRIGRSQAVHAVHALLQRWPDAQLRTVDAAGHSLFDPELLQDGGHEVGEAAGGGFPRPLRLRRVDAAPLDQRLGAGLHGLREGGAAALHQVVEGGEAVRGRQCLRCFGHGRIVHRAARCGQ